MKETPRTSSGKRNVDHEWNGRNFVEREELIEVLIAALPESEQEYIASREHHPVFSTIDMNKKLEEQAESEHLRTALRAVFLKPSEKKAA